MPFLTQEQYLEIERKAEYRSEYYGGQTLLPTGASVRHNVLVTNLILSLGPQLRNRGCAMFTTGLRLRISENDFAYPDFMIVGGKPELLGNDTLLNPTVIVEVASPSTEAFDRGVRFEQYGTIPSLKQYVLIAEDRMSVLSLSMAPRKWLQYRDPEDRITFEPGIEVRLADLYQDVDFAAE